MRTVAIPFDVLPALPVEVPRKGGAATFTAHLVGLNPAAVPGAPPGLERPDQRDRRNDRDAGGPARAVRPDHVSRSRRRPRRSDPRADTTIGDSSCRRRRDDRAARPRPARWVRSASPGRSGLSGDRALGVEAKGTINIAAASLVTDRVDAEGDATIDLQARGTVGRAGPHRPGQFSPTPTWSPTKSASPPSASMRGSTSPAAACGWRTLSADVNGGTLKGAGEASLGSRRDPRHQSRTDDRATSPTTLRSTSARSRTAPFTS